MGRWGKHEVVILMVGSKEIQKIIEMSKSHGIPGKAPKLLNNLAGDASNSEANKGNNNSKLRKP